MAATGGTAGTAVPVGAIGKSFIASGMADRLFRSRYTLEYGARVKRSPEATFCYVYCFAAHYGNAVAEAADADESKHTFRTATWRA